MIKVVRRRRQMDMDYFYFLKKMDAPLMSENLILMLK